MLEWAKDARRLHHGGRLSTASLLSRPSDRGVGSAQAECSRHPLRDVRQVAVSFPAPRIHEGAGESCGCRVEPTFVPGRSVAGCSSGGGRALMLSVSSSIPPTRHLSWADAPGTCRSPAACPGLLRISLAKVSQIVTLDRAALTERAGVLPQQTFNWCSPGSTSCSDGLSHQGRTGPRTGGQAWRSDHGCQPSSRRSRTSFAAARRSAGSLLPSAAQPLRR